MNNDLVEKRFKKCADEGRPAFVAYMTAGDPDFEASLKVAEALAEAGADIIELGVPFSDPLADGEANQLAADRALRSGMTSRKVLDLAGRIRAKFPELPLVLFTYLNPVAHSGDFLDYCRDAVKAGVNAMLPLDMPPEESEGYREAADQAGLKIVSLVAPTTSAHRIKTLAGAASSFIYYVCREGVTGERSEFASGVSEKVAEIKRLTKLPVAVGFGISTPAHVRAAASAGADGVIVGSAIVRKVEAFSKGQCSIDDIKAFAKSLADALRDTQSLPPTGA